MTLLGTPFEVQSAALSPLTFQRGLELEPGFQARWFYEFSTREIADKVAQGARLLGLPV
jgi:hypothetical protein